MEKYSRLSKITNEYLHGNLAKLQVNYEDDTNMSLSFLYEDTNHYWFDYEMNISIPKKVVEHASHFTTGYLNKVELTRETEFEKAVFNEIFTQKLQFN